MSILETGRVQLLGNSGHEISRLKSTSSSSPASCCTAETLAKSFLSQRRDNRTLQSFDLLVQDFLPRLAMLTELAVLETLAKEFRLTEC